MACIKDADVGDCFRSKLEEIRNKLIFQAMSEVTEMGIEFCHSHKQFLKSVLETCSKKCKEDETMFETIQAYKKDLEQNGTLLKEKRVELPEVVSDLEEKDLLKESLIQKIEKLKEEQAKNREVILSQNKANKNRLKNLDKVKQVFQDRLRLEIRKIKGEKLQFVFRNINHKNPDSVYTFILRINEEGAYQILSCDPPLECMVHLERRLQETNNFSAFLANVRREFVALYNDD